MPKAKAKDFASLESRIAYSFRDKKLLAEALTHASARALRPDAPDNQRLEFLGDRVLGLAAAELLLERFPEAREGDLARRFNALVRTESCAGVARSLDLGLYLTLDPGEASAGGRRKDSILADALEALLGAIFLDGGFEAARRVARALFGDPAEAAPAAPIDAKTALQEWSQGRGMSAPRYRVVGRDGPDHAPSFTVEASVDGLAPASGAGASKRAAEQSAAAALLTREGVWAEG